MANGDFASGNLAEWNVVIDPNTSVSFGFPRVESFDVDGDGQPNNAFRVRLGRLDTDLFGGAVSIEQQLLLDAGNYQFSADVASQSLETGGNSGPGNYELTFDGQIVDQVMLNGTLIASMQVIRDSLAANLMNVEAGHHTLRITVSRGATNSRAIYQLIDNIQFTSLGSASALTVPEPTTAALLTMSSGRPALIPATPILKTAPTRAECRRRHRSHRRSLEIAAEEVGEVESGFRCLPISALLQASNNPIGRFRLLAIIWAVT